MQLSRSAFLTVVRASAAYDLLLTAPFATPWTFALAHAQLSTINQHLGGDALPDFGPFHVLFACLMGSIVLVWSVLRLRAASVTLGRYDGVGRFLFSTWMAWALAASGAKRATCLPIRRNWSSTARSLTPPLSSNRVSRVLIAAANGVGQPRSAWTIDRSAAIVLPVACQP